MPFDKPQRSVDRVFLHCSASDRAEHDDIAVIRDWHVNGNGWSDVGYHFFLRKNGAVEAGRGLEEIPAAQKGHNSGTIAICLHGLAEGNFTKAQYASLIGLCREINAAYGGMVTFHGHCEVSSKSCPVFPYRRVLGLDRHGSMDLEPTESPNIAPTPAEGRPVLRLTDRGREVLELQNRLSAKGFEVEEDGAFGQITLDAVRRFQKSAGLVVDGTVGPRTWQALLS